MVKKIYSAPDMVVVYTGQQAILAGSGDYIIFDDADGDVGAKRGFVSFDDEEDNEDHGLFGEKDF